MPSAEFTALLPHLPETREYVMLDIIRGMLVFSASRRMSAEEGMRRLGAWGNAEFGESWENGEVLGGLVREMMLEWLEPEDT